jgi:hypothetical protein
MGQQPSDTSTAQDIEDAIRDFALRVLLRSAPGLGLGHEMFDQGSFFMSEVSWVRDAGFHVPRLTQRGCLLQTF